MDRQPPPGIGRAFRRVSALIGNIQCICFVGRAWYRTCKLKLVGWRFAKKQRRQNVKARTTGPTCTRPRSVAAIRAARQSDESFRLSGGVADTAGRLLPHEPLLADAQNERGDGPRAGRIRFE